MDTKVADPLHGALIGGRYRIMGRLARGGLTTVYQARDERLERAVALKIIHHDHAREPTFLERLTDEAKTVARLAHPNVVAVYDQGVHDGAPYLVMEYVRGRTLREVINDRRRLDPAESLAIIEQILAALAVAHKAGLVHRDVQPESILVAAPPNGSGDLVDAVVKVADFGLAHVVEPADAPRGEGGSGAQSVISHPAHPRGERPPAGEQAAAEGGEGGETERAGSYVAPEMATEGRGDARADVYSAGIVLFELLTGQPPLERDRSSDDIPPPSRVASGVPTLLDDVVLRATRRDPTLRPRDAGAMLDLVQTARDDVGALAGPTRAIAHPTVVVPLLPGEGTRGQDHGDSDADDARPSWARLPVQRGGAVLGAGGGALADGRDSVASTWPRVANLVPAGSLRRLGQATGRHLDQLRGTQRGRRQLTAMLIVVGLLLLAGGWYLGFGRYTEAPSLVDLTRANAVQEAARLGFSVNVGAGIYAETVPVDTVLRQTPGPGGRVLRGGTVTLFLSLGPQRELVPNVAGQSADFALSQLKFFVVETVGGFSDTLPVGYVIGTDPPAGTSAKPSSPLKLIVVKGPFAAHVPSVVGLARADAENQLKAQGFTVQVAVRDDATQPKDKVLEQNPPGGQGVPTASGVPVVLTVASGPPGTPMPGVVGARCQEAVGTLRGAGLQVEVQGNAIEKEFGSVKAQSPNPNESVPAGQRVQIQCGL